MQLSSQQPVSAVPLTNCAAISVFASLWENQPRPQRRLSRHRERGNLPGRRERPRNKLILLCSAVQHYWLLSGASAKFMPPVADAQCQVFCEDDVAGVFPTHRDACEHSNKLSPSALPPRLAPSS